MRFKTLVTVVLVAALVGCGGASRPSVASRCSDYGTSFANSLVARFPRPDQLRTLRLTGEGRCLLLAQCLKMPSNPTDAEWDNVLKALNPPAVRVGRPPVGC